MFPSNVDVYYLVKACVLFLLLHNEGFSNTQVTNVVVSKDSKL
jgi:hypothetical protein